MTNNQAIEALLRIRCIIHEDSLEEQALVYAIEALEGKDTDVPSNDTISRQAAIDAVHKNYDTILDFTSDGHTVADSFEDIINALPTAQPERKTGRWIYDGDCYVCSECQSAYGWWADSQVSNYCPNCGAEMRGK